MAQRLDLPRAALTGAPVTLADGVAIDAFFQSPISVAGTGLVAYRMGAGSQRQLKWVDRSGKALGAIGDADGNSLSNPRLSPDGRRVAVSRTVQGNTDLWLMDGARTRRFTFDAASDNYPVWSPDGTRIVFRSTRTGQGDLFQKLASGAGVEERLVASEMNKSASSWSGDGRFLLLNSRDPQTSMVDLWIVPMEGDGRPAVLLETPFREVWGTFSPDGRWLAYHSNESGRNEVYVRPFVPPGTAGATARAADVEWQVSAAGGTFPTWRPDGKELYYLDAAGAMVAAPIIVTGATLAPGAPVPLFASRIAGGGVDNEGGRQYDVAPDGRFLINAVLDSTTAPITLLMDWNPAKK